MWIGVLNKILSSFVDGRIIVVDQWEARSLTGKAKDYKVSDGRRDGLDGR
jgi:hypothetical protein